METCCIMFLLSRSHSLTFWFWHKMKSSAFSLVFVMLYVWSCCTCGPVVRVVLLCVWSSCACGPLVRVVLLCVWLSSCTCGPLVCVVLLYVWSCCMCGPLVRVVLLQDPGCMGYLPASTDCTWLWREDWRCSAFLWQVDGEPDWVCRQWRSVSIQRLLPDSHKFWQGVSHLTLYIL